MHHSCQGMASGRHACVRWQKQQHLKLDLPLQVVVPRTFPQFTSRRALTTSWLEGEKLSQSRESDVGSLVNLGVICYLKQLLETGLCLTGLVI